MGSTVGHIIPGFMFVTFGLWWFYNVLMEYIAKIRKDQKMIAKNQRSWKKLQSSGICRPIIVIEPWLKLLGGIAGIFVELSSANFVFEEKHHGPNTNNFSHAAMYSFFSLSGLVELTNYYDATNLSVEFEYIIFAMAFCIEGLLFFFHLQNRDVVDTRIHTILFLIIFATSVVLFLEACAVKHRQELFMARTVLCLTQGTWFWQIACTLYGPTAWFEDANVLTEHELVIYTGKITVTVCVHIIAWCMLLILSCLVASCYAKKTAKKWSTNVIVDETELIDSVYHGEAMEENLNEEKESLLKSHEKVENMGGDTNGNVGMDF